MTTTLFLLSTVLGFISGMMGSWPLFFVAIGIAVFNDFLTRHGG